MLGKSACYQCKNLNNRNKKKTNSVVCKVPHMMCAKYRWRLASFQSNLLYLLVLDFLCNKTRKTRFCWINDSPSLNCSIPYERVTNYRPQQQLREGNVFTGICRSFCSQGCVGIPGPKSFLGVSVVPGPFGGGYVHPLPATDTWWQPPHVRSASGR